MSVPPDSGPSPILLVEDNPLTRKMMRLTLEGEGFSVLEAEDGKTALELIGAGPALVVQDLMLPDMDGLELLARLRSRPASASLPVLVVSGLVSRRSEIEARRDQITEFLSKPVEPEQLIAAVRAFLPRRGEVAAPLGGGRRLLLVEDDRLNRKLALARLRAAGFAVTATANAEEALALVGSARPDVVLSDVLMPGLDGFRLCQALRSLPGLEQLPVVLLSSCFIEPADRELARAMGAHALVRRTPDLAEAVEAVVAAASDETAAQPIETLPSLYADRLTATLERELERYGRITQRASVHAAALSLTAGLFRAIESGEHLAAVMGDVLIHCLDAAGLSRGALFLVEGPRDLNLGAHCGLDPERLRAAREAFGHPELLRHALASGLPLAVDPASGEEGQRELLDRLGAASVLIVPFSAGGHNYGVLLLASETHDLLDAEWGSFARTLRLQFNQAVALGQALSRKATSERELRELFERVPVGIYRAGRGGVILTANRALAAMLGFVHAEGMIDRRAAELWADPAERATWEHRLAAEGEVRGYETWLRRRDGGKVRVRMTARSEPDGQGGVAYHEAVVEDVTAERAALRELEVAQQKLQDVVASSPSVLYSLHVSSQGMPTPIWFSPNLVTLGFSPNDALERSWFFSQLHPADLEVATAGLGELARDDHHVMEYRFADAAGSYRWIRDEQRVTARLPDGSFEVSGSWSDVTARRELEERFLQAQKLESLGQLAGGVAHDFNNLLCAIDGYAELALMRLKPEDPLAADLGEIHRAAERAAGLTRQLLAFSRRQVMSPTVVDLNEVLASMKGMLQRLIAEDIELELQLAPALARVRVDRGQLEQVVLNLVVNARDAMPDGGKLVVATEPGAEPGDEGAAGAVLRVTDSGSGMDEATQARIFEPFFTTKEQGKGTGLGLSTVYGIVQQSGGTLQVRSRVGEGTTFRVLLPPAPAAVEAPPTLLASPAEPPPRTASATVLLVEDEAAVRDLIERALRRGGYEVLTAKRAAEASDVLDRHGAVDLLITDVVLPGGSGFALVERLQAAGRLPAVLFISGYAPEAVAGRGDVGRWPHLEKPFTIVRLLAEVRSALDAR
jgi:PAS domain S-box-containing protein